MSRTTFYHGACKCIDETERVIVIRKMDGKFVCIARGNPEVMYAKQSYIHANACMPAYIQVHIMHFGDINVLTRPFTCSTCCYGDIRHFTHISCVDVRLHYMYMYMCIVRAI